MRRHKKSIVLLALLLVAFAYSGIAFGWPWNTDMYWHPSIKPFSEPPRDPPEDTLAIDQEIALTREEMGKIYANPIPASEESVERGRRFYETMCLVCHGERGLGDGPVGKKFVTPSNLTLQMYKDMTDGYIYATIRNGAASMPPQGSALYMNERWDVVNYVRSLQKK